MKKLDQYIMRNFIGTFVFMTMLLAIIVLVIDFSQRISKIQDNGSTIGAALTDYYPFFLLWMVNTFLPIGVFISAIYFTSRLANNTEIVAMTSGGMSFFRLTRPYLIVALSIGAISFVVNHFWLPEANIHKNEYYYNYLQRSSNEREYFKGRPIAARISPNEYIFLHNYSRITNNGNGFLFQKFDGIDLVYSLRANDLIWNQEDSIYSLNRYYERFVREGKRDSLVYGNKLEQRFDVTPDQLLPEGYVAETMNSIELRKFIEREKFKGSGSVSVYLNELYQRTSLPFSSIILTLLALSLASQKKRGGLGLNLAIGISLAFVYIFGNEASKVLASVGDLDPLLAVWMSNIIFGILTIFLYFKRAFS
ncbi:LptF/LptG family permease [Flavobacteriaceae bacterium Ap0902]|nr:LptF/LptG family permease [Flavobacteriaceae bacterium Ap0902]